MNTFLHSSYQYILVGEKQTFFVGKKLSQMNYGCELLNNGLMPILALPELYKQSPALGRGKDAHLFQDILYYSLEGGIDIFYDVQGLLITFLGRSKIYTPPPVIGFHFKRQVYICSYKWLHRNLHRLYGLLSDSWIDIFHTLDRCIYASFISASHIDRIRGTLSILTLPELMSTDHLYRVSSDGKIMPIISPDDVRISGFQEHSTIIDNPNKNTIGNYTPNIDGIINNSGTRYNKSYGLYCTVSRYSFSNTMDMKNKGSSGLSVGISRDKSQSKIKSYAEGFERYYSSYTNHDQKHSTHSIFGDTEKSIVESITGCEGDFVIGNTYESYSIYELRKIEVGTIQTGCKHNIPGTIVQYPHIDNTIYPANSSSIAAGPSYTDAIISGYLELIERHYIIDGWLHTWSPMQINRETLPIDIQHILSQIEHDFKGKISILCTGIDPIPGILILFENTERIKIGAACKESTHDAVHKAISEILTGLLFDKENREPISRIEDVHSVVDHNNYYKVAEHRKHLLYLQDGPIIDYGSIPLYTDTKSLINTSIQAGGDSLYVADLTSEESRKYGVYIVRVMSSKLLPIWFGNNGKIPLLKTHIGTLDANKKIHFFD